MTENKLIENRQQKSSRFQKEKEIMNLLRDINIQIGEKWEYNQDSHNLIYLNPQKLNIKMRSENEQKSGQIGSEGTSEFKLDCNIESQIGAEQKLNNAEEERINKAKTAGDSLLSNIGDFSDFVHPEIDDYVDFNTHKFSTDFLPDQDFEVNRQYDGNELNSFEERINEIIGGYSNTLKRK
jgi:hypothetical protein